MSRSENLLYSTMDAAQVGVLKMLLSYGCESSPRGRNTLEIIPLTFELENPRSRVLVNPARKWSFPLAIGEFCWHASGSQDARFLSYYAKRWAEFSLDGETIGGSCYGLRVFGGDQGDSQWVQLVNLLKTDPSTRRAVLFFGGADDRLDPKSLDVACATSMQFLIRDGQLDAIVYMRSNDAIWGLSYDVFLFTMIQEYLAEQLSLDIGRYVHFAASMHLYEEHIALAERIIDSANAFSDQVSMPKMVSHTEIFPFIKAEEKIRRREAIDASASLKPYWSDLLDVLSWFGEAKQSIGEAPDTAEFISNGFYAHLADISPHGAQNTGAPK